MIGYLVDTNVLSERRKPRADPSVIEWIGAHVGDLWLSVMVVAEVRIGIERVRRPDPVFAGRLEAWVRLTLDEFGGRVLPITLPIADRWARLSVPDPLPFVDGLLAATAIEHDLTLVTRNVGDVERTGVRVVDPFSPA